MALIYDCSMAADFLPVTTLQAFGVSGTGVMMPSGIGDSLYISNGAMVAHIRDTDPAIGLGNRSEITGPVDFAGDERWYAWDFCAPSWPTKPDGQWFSVMQIHDSPDAGDLSRSPNALILYDGVSLQLNVPLMEPPIQDTRYRCLGGVRADQGIWHRLSLHILWSKTGVGMIDFYVDGASLCRKTQIGTAYDDVGGQYFKLGVYDYAHAGGYGDRSALFKNVKIWTTDPGYVAFLGRTPVAQAFTS